MSADVLPAAIIEYYATSARGDNDALAECFTEDATVLDESREWRGRDGVREWRTTVTNAFAYTTEIRGFSVGEREGRELVEVVVHLEGNFPGGEVDLVNSFELRDGRIAHLRTGG
jgi:ketosteroid isomerase-like protein